MAKKAIIWESSVDGHRLVYAQEVLNRAACLNIDVELALPRKLKKNEQVRVHLSDSRTITSCDTLSDAVGEALSCSAHLILLSGDDKLLPLLRTFQLPTTTVLIMNDPAWISGSRLRKLAKGAVIDALGRRSGVQVLRLCANAPLAQVRPDSVPDPVLLGGTRAEISNGATLIRREASIRTGVTWVGMVGGISQHKNPLLVARAMQHLDSSVGFALLGPQPQDVRDSLRPLLASRAWNRPTAILDRRLTNIELSSAISSLDVLVCAYSTQAPNSTSARAHYLGIRVVGAGSGAFLRNGQRYWTTSTTDVDTASISSAIHRALNTPSPPASDPPPGTDFADRILGVA